MRVLVIDYGMGNLASVRNVLKKIGVQAIVSNDPNDIHKADKVVLPGVGAFFNGINNLMKLNWCEILKKEIYQNEKPFLGICLGMQLLASIGTEFGQTDGLGFISGEVIQLEPIIKGERLPHVGWNEVVIKKSDPIFNNIPNNSDFYFAHSYHFAPNNSENVLALTPYCKSFVSVINDNNIYGVQFHPEKSGDVGIQLIKNFLEI